MSRWPIDPAEVVLGVLTTEEQLIADRLLGEDPGFRREVDRLSTVATKLAATGGRDPGAPAALELTAARAARAAPSGRRRRRRLAPLVLRPTAAVGAATVLIAIGGLGGVLVGGERDPAPGVEPTLASVRLAAFGLAPSPRRATVALRVDAASLDVRGLAPSRRGEHYELWLLNSGEDLVSVGTFRVGADHRIRADFPLGVDPRRYALLDISIEPDDGDPGHSSRSVLRSIAKT